MSEEFDEYEADEDAIEEEDLDDEDLENLDEEFEPRDEYEDIDEELENDFEPRDESEVIDEDLENNFEPRDEPSENQEQEKKEDITEENAKDQQFGREQPIQKPDKTPPKEPPKNFDMWNPGDKEKDRLPPSPPREPKQRRPKGGPRIPIGPETKGPLLNKDIRDAFKKKNWRKIKKRFTKTDDEIKQELTTDQYRKLKHDKIKK